LAAVTDGLAIAWHPGDPAWIDAFHWKGFHRAGDDIEHER
jgi:hypothetical protein